MKKINVEVPGKNYSVYIGSNIINRLPVLTAEINLPESTFFVIDSNVHKYYGRIIGSLKKKFGGKLGQIILTVNESNKKIETVEKIYSSLLSENFGRDTLLIAIGGGITGDVAGFAAASYMRGIPYVQIPTTILAAADSSVGGKTGVNFQNYKNQIGAFYQPSLVLIDTNFFGTLPDEELICGFGEIVKYAYLIDKKFFDYVSKIGSKVPVLSKDEIVNLISVSVKFKAGVVRSDEKESGLRKILNLGHTFAHAIESAMNYRIKHGQAVIAGLLCSFYLSNKLGIISEKQLNEFLLLPLGLKKFVSLRRINKEKMYESMFTDKKNRRGKIHFVLTKDIGKILVDIEAKRDDILFAIEKGIRHFN